MNFQSDSRKYNLDFNEQNPWCYDFDFNNAPLQEEAEKDNGKMSLFEKNKDNGKMSLFFDSPLRFRR